MRLKLPLAIIAFLLVLNSCKKDNHDPQPIKNNPPPAVVSFTIANILQSNMVIQRNKPLMVWGTAKAASSITVNASWLTNAVTTKANASGVWTVSVNVGGANTSAQTITVSSANSKSISLTNILIGDVWVCSGQ